MYRKMLIDEHENNLMIKYITLKMTLDKYNIVKWKIGSLNNIFNSCIMLNNIK